MSSNEIREPIQKRSIEKKEKIIEAGFELICKKGYYNTNTAEIAKSAAQSKKILPLRRVLTPSGMNWPSLNNSKRG